MTACISTHPEKKGLHSSLERCSQLRYRVYKQPQLIFTSSASSPWLPPPPTPSRLALRSRQVMQHLPLRWLGVSSIQNTQARAFWGRAAGRSGGLRGAKVTFSGRSTDIHCAPTKQPGTSLSPSAVAAQTGACPETSLPAAPLQRELESQANWGDGQAGSGPGKTVLKTRIRRPLREGARA